MVPVLHGDPDDPPSDPGTHPWSAGGRRGPGHPERRPESDAPTGDRHDARVARARADRRAPAQVLRHSRHAPPHALPSSGRRGLAGRRVDRPQAGRDRRQDAARPRRRPGDLGSRHPAAPRGGVHHRLCGTQVGGSLEGIHRSFVGEQERMLAGLDRTQLEHRSLRIDGAVAEYLDQAYDFWLRAT